MGRFNRPYSSILAFCISHVITSYYRMQNICHMPNAKIEMVRCRFTEKFLVSYLKIVSCLVDLKWSMRSNLRMKCLVCFHYIWFWNAAWLWNCQTIFVQNDNPDFIRNSKWKSNAESIANTYTVLLLNDRIITKTDWI